MKNTYDNEKIDVSNLNRYLNDTYGNCKIVSKKIIYNVPCLLQSNYGKSNDCTLTCITTCISFLLKTLTRGFEYVYSKVEKYANQYGYDEQNGTNPLKIKKIYDLAYEEISGKSRKSYSKYIKNIAVTENIIKKNIDNNNLIILSFASDGRNYYKNHSVTIIGYLDIKYKNNTKNNLILAIHDNWNEEVTYIDFKKLSTICSINY